MTTIATRAVTALPSGRRHSLSNIALSDSQGYLICNQSRDRTLFYASKGNGLYSTPDGVTYTLIHNFPNPVNGVICLANGELFVGLNGKDAYTSSGYSQSNPTAATWPNTLNLIGGSYISQVYSLNQRNTDATGRIVICEAGLQTQTANDDAGNAQYARRVWESLDFGKTWNVIFDAYLNAPNYEFARCHMHGCCIERGTGKVWITMGDNGGSTQGPTTNTPFSQIAHSESGTGAPWTFVNNSDITTGFQWVSIRATPDRITMLPDGNPYFPYSIERNKSGGSLGTMHIGPMYCSPANGPVGQYISQLDGTDGVFPWPIFAGLFGNSQVPRERIMASSDDGRSFYEIWRGAEIPGGGGNANLFGPNPSGLCLGNSLINNGGAWANGALLKATITATN